MTHGDLALQNSDLDPFLFAEIGTERNGMALTVTSLIARAGEDPWNEAKRLSTLPRVVAIDDLAGVIARMPRSLWALDDATVIAARVVSLLPSRAHAARRNAGGSSGWSAVPPWARTSLLYAAMAAWLAVTMIAFHGPPVADHHPALHHTASDAPLAATPVKAETTNPQHVSVPGAARP